MGIDYSRQRSEIRQACRDAKCNKHAYEEFTSGDRKNLYNYYIGCQWFPPSERMQRANPYFNYQNWNEVSEGVTYDARGRANAMKPLTGDYNLCGGDICGSGGTNSFVKKSRHAIKGYNRFMVFWRTRYDEQEKGSNCNRMWWDDPVRKSTSARLLENCKKACYNTEWCQSFDMHRKLGRCYLSDKTQHTAELVSSGDYDYYEKKPELA